DQTGFTTGTGGASSASASGTSSASGAGGFLFDGGDGCEPCKPTEVCADGKCVNACANAEKTKSSIGCEYYTVDMDSYSEVDKVDVCFAVFVANASGTNAHITAAFDGTPIDLAKYALIPKGAGKALTYGAYDPMAGLPTGEVAILFLADSDVPYQ